MIVRLPSHIWRGKEIELAFPGNWDIRVLRMKGDDSRPWAERKCCTA